MTRPRVLVLFSCLLLLCWLPAALAQNAPPQIEFPVTGPLHFIAYGDIRFTDPAKTKPSDPVRRDLLVNQIAQQKPAFVVITGDLVLDGSVPDDWARWDKETQPFKDAGIKIFPVLGNHDARGDAALASYSQRFPDLEQARYYKLRAGNALFFMFDSNANVAGDPLGAQELRWLGAELEHIPDDVQFVFITEHHPLITRSSNTMLPGEGMGAGGHSLRSQEAKLATMLEAARAKVNKPFIVLAGHVHNYEHYQRNGVTYITTGGGGATPYRIARRARDAYSAPGPTYHYCDITIDNGTLSFHMVKLESEGETVKWTVRDAFTLKSGEKAKAAD